jgi:hypothetical protein
MPFTVIWQPPALVELADCWNRSTNRTAVTKAANRVDVQLRFDPDQQGIDFYGDRLLVVPPLHVIYQVKPDDMLVEILQVW